jgi:hypothetical protein
MHERDPVCSTSLSYGGQAGGRIRKHSARAAAGQPRADQPRRKHARVIDDQQIAGDEVADGRSLKLNA